jgi:dihydrofolate reductase
VLSGDIEHEVRALKEQDGGDILIAGSTSLVTELASLGLIDEYRLMVFPIVLGTGKRLLAGTTGAPALKLVGCQELGSGTLILTYHRA